MTYEAIRFDMDCIDWALPTRQTVDAFMRGPG